VPALLRRFNVRQVLEILQRQGPCTRADLTRCTRISAPTMSKLVEALVRQGVLERTRKRRHTGGRPAVVFQFARGRGGVAGIVLDIREIVLTAAGLDGRPDPAHVRRIPTPRSFDLLVETVADEFRRFWPPALGPCRGVGMTLPGLIDRRSGLVRFSPNLHFLDSRNPAEALSRRLGIAVAAFQEEHALALAARRFGAARDLSDFALIDISAGFGMGVVSAGRFIEGARGFAGEIGHLRVRPEGPPCSCGNRGCLETVASDTALAAAVSAREGRTMTMDEIIAEVRAGRLRLEGLLEDVLEHLAFAVSVVVNIFNPEAVLLHGRLFEIEDNLLNRLAERARRMALAPSMEQCRIVYADADKPLGAIAGILERVYDGIGPRALRAV